MRSLLGTAPLSLALLLILMLVAPVAGQTPAVDVDELERHYREYVLSQDDFLCGTTAAMVERGAAPVPTAPVADGAPVYFHQDPPILEAGKRSKLTLTLVVVGDVDKLTFDPTIFDTNTNWPNETWRRDRTEKVGGKSVSIFEPSWSADQVDRFFFAKNSGFDRPDLLLGAIVVGSGSNERRFFVRVRVAPSDLPRVKVRRAGRGIFYTSDVVNLVIPDYGDSRILSDTQDVDLDAVARKFFKKFKDQYHSIAVVPQALHLSDEFFAFHQNVRNSIRGIGAQVFDNRATFGSSGPLEGMEFYTSTSYGRPATTVHEFLHQWGHYFDWERIASIKGAGHQPSAHTPLMDGGPTMIGAVLVADREVVRDRGFAIGFPEVPYLAHPLTMYAMGFFGTGKVPMMDLFQNQGQFDPNTSSSPDVGTKIKGGSQEIGIKEIRAVHGGRNGPKASRKYRRATVVVSRNGKLSREEFAYFTLLTQRQAYNKRDDGVLSHTGYGPIFQTTRRKIKLDTSIEPKKKKQLRQRLDVAFPTFGKDAWRGVRLDSKMKSRIQPGQTVNISGKVTATDRDDFDSVVLRFTRHDPAGDSSAPMGIAAPGIEPRDAHQLRFWGDVTANGQFDVDVEFSKKEKGRYNMEIFLFWPNSGNQFSRASRTPIHVQ